MHFKMLLFTRIIKNSSQSRKGAAKLIHTRTSCRDWSQGGPWPLAGVALCSSHCAVFCSPHQKHYGEELNRMLMVILLSKSKTWTTRSTWSYSSMLIQTSLFQASCWVSSSCPDTFSIETQKVWDVGFQMLDVFCKIKQILGCCKTQELTDGCWQWCMNSVVFCKVLGEKQQGSVQERGTDA